MTNEKKCARCGERAETRDNIAETTFWGLIETSIEKVTSKSVRVASTYVRGHGPDTRILSCDEQQPLCSPCWGLLIGYFMQGRPVAPVKHEHEWKLGGRIGEYPREVCDLCLQDRIAIRDDANEDRVARPATFEDRFAEAIRRDQETGALPNPTEPTPTDHPNGGGER